MPEEVSPTIEQKEAGADAARPGGNGTAVDQSSQTLKGGALPHSDASPPGNVQATLSAVAADTKPVTGPSDVTMAGPSEGVTLIAPPFQGSVGSSTSDATLNSAPHDATLGGVDGATAAFHQAALEAAPKPITKGASFGNYELLEPIAKGGMGIVYKARQRNLNRIVAIKMILAGQFADQEDINRFYAEAEAAAALSHPNIVAIHEIGETSGQHFFSMDFIEGKSLSALIQENPVPPRRAAEFMITISETMQFAHESGVVHRDLKPANVLLDKRQRPLITDFGLAKQVSNTSQMTMAGSIVGTPSYMPPEQAAGKLDEIGPWSDLYSLGAILYELLTARPPFRASSPFETIRQVLETEPPSPRLLNPNVPKDLETICLKCLQKERPRRYGSAQELADELKRFLRGEPIHARPISQAARFWRLCKRHPVTSSAIASAVLFLVTATIVSTASYFVAAAANARDAKSFSDLNEAVDKFFTIVGEQRLANLPGGQPIQKELLDEALAYNEKFLRERGNDPRVANEAARSQFRVGKISMTLGRYDDALVPLLTARQIQERLVAKQPNDEKRLKALGDTLTELGQIHIRKKEYDAAVEDYAEAAKIRGRLAAAMPQNMEYQRLHANAHMNAAIAAFNLAQIDPSDSRFESRMSEARDSFERAQKIRLAAIEHHKKNLQLRRDLAKGYYNLGDLARVDNRLSDAIDNFKKADAVFEELLKEKPDELDDQRDVATCRRLVGSLLLNEGKEAEARQWYQQALDHLDTLVKENPDVPDYRAQQGSLWLNLADLERSEGNRGAAQAALERARSIYAALAKKSPDVPVYQRDLAVTIRELAAENKNAGRVQAAEDDLLESIRIFAALVQKYPNELEYAFEQGVSYYQLARVEGATSGGMDECNRAIGICQSLIAQNPKDADSQKLLADCRRLRGDLFKTNNQISDALQAYHEALSGLDALVTSRPDEPGYRALQASLWMNVFELENDRLFDVEGKEDHAAAARAAVKQAREILDGLVKEVPEETTNQYLLATALTNQFDLEKNEGRKDAARLALDGVENVLNPLAKEFPDDPFCRSRLADLLMSRAEFEVENNNLIAAESLLEQARRIIEALLAPNGENVHFLSQRALCLANFSSLHLKQGDLKASRSSLANSQEVLNALLKTRPNDAYVQLLSADNLLDLSALEKLAGNPAAARSALQQAKAIFQPLAEEYKTSAGKFALVLLELAKQEHALGNDTTAKQNLADARLRLKLLVKRFPNTIKFRELLQEADAVEFSSSANQ